MLEIGGLGLADQDIDERRRLVVVERVAIRQQLALLGRGAAIGNRLDGLAVDQRGDRVAGHLVGRIPARADGDVERAGIDHRVRPVPADRFAELDRGARPVGFVAGRIGSVVEHAVLDVDQPGEHQLGQRQRPVRPILHQPEEDPIGGQHVAAVHQSQPIGQPLLEAARLVHRFLIGPVHHRRRRRRPLGQLIAPGIVPRRPQDLLVPDVEAGRDVPDRLRHRQGGVCRRQHGCEMQGGPGAQQAMIVVDEVDEAGVDPLVIGHVGIGPVDADRREQHLGERPAGPNQVVVGVAGAGLVARQDPRLQLGVRHPMAVLAALVRACFDHPIAPVCRDRGRHATGYRAGRSSAGWRCRSNPAGGSMEMLGNGRQPVSTIEGFAKRMGDLR